MVYSRCGLPFQVLVSDLLPSHVIVARDPRGATVMDGAFDDEDDTDESNEEAETS